MNSYASYTRGTAEPIKAIAHSRRFHQAAKIIGALPTDTVLDYGCADAHLFSVLGDVKERAGYDPDPNMLAQIAPELRGIVQTFNNLDDLLGKRRFSLIVCMEVCEHLTDVALDQLFSNIRTLAAPEATIVFGVPIETGLSGFFKSLYRIANGGRQSASVANALKSLFRLKITRKETDVEWYGSHTGFDYADLRGRIEGSGFRVRRSRCLPLPVLGSILNNEIYFVCSVTELG